MVDSKAQGGRAVAVSLVHIAEGYSLGRTSSRSLHWCVSTAPPHPSLPRNSRRLWTPHPLGPSFLKTCGPGLCLFCQSQPRGGGGVQRVLWLIGLSRAHAHQELGLAREDHGWSDFSSRETANCIEGVPLRREEHPLLSGHLKVTVASQSFLLPPALWTHPHKSLLPVF